MTTRETITIHSEWCPSDDVTGAMLRVFDQESSERSCEKCGHTPRMIASNGQFNRSPHCSGKGDVTRLILRGNCPGCCRHDEYVMYVMSRDGELRYTSTWEPHAIAENEPELKPFWLGETKQWEPEPVA